METAESLPAALPGEPTRLGRWLFVVALIFSYLIMQVVFALPAVFYHLFSHPPASAAELQAFLASDYMIWTGLVALILAAVLTIVVAVAWPWIWERFTGRRFALSEWLAWRRPERLPLWSVPLLTVPVAGLMGLVALLVGPAEVEVQLELFRTSALQVASTLVVSSIVPFAEEFIFRGALYNALVPGERAGHPAWQRHVAPYVLTTLAFAVVHIPAGVVTWPAFVQILILSAYLTALRAATGSVKPSTLAHLLWNLIAAMGLIASLAT